MTTPTWYEDVTEIVATAPTTPARAPETRATLTAVLTEMVTKGMGIPTTPAPAAATPAPAPAEDWTRLPLVTEAVTKGIDLDDGAFAPLIGGIACITLLLVICIIVVLLWRLSRHKGSYVTKEMDDDHVDDEESVGSDMALESWGPLETNEDA